MRYNGNQRKGIGKWVLSILLAASITLSFVPEGVLVLDAYAKESAAGEQTDAEDINESTGELEFICGDTITEDGTASLAFTNASDYVLTIVDDESGAMEPVWPVVTVIIAIAAAAIAVVFLHEKRRGKRTPSRKKKNKRRTAMPKRQR